jgi:hypothetical protein
MAQDGYIYAIIKYVDDYYLGKFNENLEKAAMSREKISDNTFISFYNDFIYINSSTGEILVLNKNSLEYINKIKP